MIRSDSPSWRALLKGLLLMIGLGLTLLPVTSAAQTCGRDAFRKIVDETGQALRRLHSESQPRLTAGFRRLKALNGWSEEEHIDRAMELVADTQAATLDNRAAELLARLDKLADFEGETGDCNRLAELEAASIELKATVRAKTEHTIARLDRLARDKEAAARPAAPAPAPKSPDPKIADQALTEPPRQPPAAKPAPATPIVPAPPAKPPAKGWTTTTRENPSAPPPVPQAPSPPPVALPLPAPSQDGFSIEEIREASRGFFGTVSSGLANVIEHAFSQAGRPTGYVLGTEGGGAFIAGLRYGRGTLFTRGGRSREVFWHGPSIGYDFGASGARTMFLVYNLREELDIFSGFSGIEGSAYLVGGVGLTFVTDGRVVLAPIRSGIGLRLGANVGYLRFTARPTWNPF